MATGTTLIAFRSGLVTRLTARAALAGVQVAKTMPGTEPGTELAAESIWFADAESDHEIPVMKAGTKKVDEVFTLAAVVQVLILDGRDQDTADLRAVALLAELQQELAETPHTIDSVDWAEMAGWNYVGGALGGGTSRGSRFDVLLRVAARLG